MTSCGFAACIKAVAAQPQQKNACTKIQLYSLLFFSLVPLFLRQRCINSHLFKINFIRTFMKKSWINRGRILTLLSSFLMGWGDDVTSGESIM
jgi:hypothetical protein